MRNVLGWSRSFVCMSSIIRPYSCSWSVDDDGEGFAFKQKTVLVQRMRRGRRCSSTISLTVDLGGWASSPSMTYNSGVIFKVPQLFVFAQVQSSFEVHAKLGLNSEK